jgi:hypothetical protein
MKRPWKKPCVCGHGKSFHRHNKGRCHFEDDGCPCTRYEPSEQDVESASAMDVGSDVPNGGAA